MEYKFIGLAFIVALSLYIAICIRRYAEDKVRFYTAVHGFVSYIRNQIEYFCTPTEEFIDSFSDDFLERCGFLRDIDGNQWEQAIAKCRYLDRENAHTLRVFSSKLGRTGRDEQIANCEYAMEEISKSIDTCRRDTETRYKAYSALAVITGFMVVILLI